MRTPSRMWALSATLLLAGSLAACGGADDGDGATPGATASSGVATDAMTDEATGATSDAATDDSTDDATDDSSPGETVIVKAADSGLGTILVDGAGMTLYLFTNDTPGVSNCEDACLTAWPPLLGSPEDGDGIEDSLLSTLQRSDGTTQVAYNGWPLYYWQNDVAPGDTTGQAVNDVWWVVSPEGEAIGVGQ